jgi:drug/metabolite transporter (DMT)-like permease
MVAYLELVGAALAYTAGNLLQTIAAGRSRRVDRLDPGLLRRLAHDRLYVLGFTAQVLGFGLAFLSRATLPLYLSQAGSDSAVGLTAVAGVIFLGWRLRRSEVVALLGMVIGVGLLAGSAVPSAAAPMSYPTAAVMAVLVVVAVGLGSLAARVEGPRGAVALGTCAGLAFGVLAVIGRSLAGGPLVALPARPLFWLMVLAALVGQALFAAALQRGSATAAVASMGAVATLLGSAAGLWLLADQVVAGRGPWIVVGLGLVVGGVWLLAAVVQPHHEVAAVESMPRVRKEAPA